MNILLINTAQDPARVVLLANNQIQASRECPLDKTLGQGLLEAITATLDEASVQPEELERVVVHEGPGIRTMALRTGIITAASLAYAWNCELAAVAGENEAELVKKAHTATPTTVVHGQYRNST